MAHSYEAQTDFEASLGFTIWHTVLREFIF
jgi:hypothetical protein